MFTTLPYELDFVAKKQQQQQQQKKTYVQFVITLLNTCTSCIMFIQHDIVFLVLLLVLLLSLSDLKFYASSTPTAQDEILTQEFSCG